ncbi:MAG: AAA family ATPase [Bacteroidales bacterium]
MERTAMQQLVRWMKDEYRKPLILRGARQVGKTWLMKEFGRRYFEQTVYVNLEVPDRSGISLCRILTRNGSWLPFNALRYPDRAGEHPSFWMKSRMRKEELTALKYFAENAGDYFVLSAGSLLGVYVACKDLPSRWGRWILWICIL